MGEQMSSETSHTQMSTQPKSWLFKGHNFVAHKLSIKSKDPALSPIECGMILDPRMVPFLPTNLVALEPPIRSCFRVSSAGGKGAGMFAAEYIPAGAVIVREYPIMITPALLLDSGADEAYSAMSAQLHPHVRQQLFTMSNFKSSDECGPEEGISYTNGADINLAFPPSMGNDPEGREYGAVCLNVHRSNHSCGPNAIQKWDLATFTHTLYAMRPILSGEEITKTYTDITAPRAIRMAKLQRSYGFSCDCPYCTLPTPEAIARSDAARAELRDWRNTHPTYMKWSKDLCRADDTVIQSHLRALELIDQEGMHGMQGIFLEEIALSYAILGQEVEFRIWAERVVELWKELDPEQSEEYTKYLANPKSFKQWAWRKKQKLQMRGGRRLQREQAGSAPTYELSILDFMRPDFSSH